MIVRFEKYQGAGNDFIIVDNSKGTLVELNDTKIIQNMCDRHFGIGADGMILYENDKKLDFSMRYFNADGHEGSMCGNGGRCVVAFAKKHGFIENKTRFNAIDGLHEAEILSDKTIALKMSDVNEIRSMDNGIFVDTGSPHYIQFVENLNHINVNKQGKLIRNRTDFFAEGVNVNFVQAEKNALRIRTYERGVESETMACGTGSVAVAIASKKDAPDGFYKANINTLGGTLKVRFNKKGTTFCNVYLTGPACFVFDGEYSLQG